MEASTATVTVADSPDGTVQLVLAEGTEPFTAAALAAYQPRVVGDRVRFLALPGMPLVLGTVGTPTAGQTVEALGWEVGTTAKPTPWIGVTAVYALPDATVPGGWRGYLQLSVPPPPDPPATTKTVTALELGRYRDGQIFGRGYAEQGIWGGHGPHTGLLCYGTGAWSFLAGKTVDAVTITVHRRNAGGTAGPVPVRFWLHPFIALPNDAGPADLFLAVDTLQPVVHLARDQTASVAVPVSWGQALAAGTALGVGVYGDGNAEVDRADLTITWH